MGRLLSFALFAIATAASAEQLTIVSERFYNQLIAEASSPRDFFATLEAGTSDLDQSARTMIAVDAIWSLSESDDVMDYALAAALVREFPVGHVAAGDLIRLLVLGSRLQLASGDLGSLRAALEEAFANTEWDQRSVITANSHRDLLSSEFGVKRVRDILDRNANDLEYVASLLGGFRAKTKAELKDLVFNRPNLGGFLGGDYVNTSAIFMFCRHDRNYPCRYIIRDKNNNLARTRAGALWTQPSLAQSAKGLPYDTTGGYTPSGVLTIDSVMPDADNRPAFGNYRRFILNFVPRSAGENTLKTVLPDSAKQSDWWKESVVARDAGRNLLRIHGTGKRSDDPAAPYFPHVKTSGCVSQLEGKYGEKVFVDQRHLLDAFMASLGLDPTYDNEARIKGLFYVIEVDETRSAVSDADIRSWLDL
jgi:hypothetical protein